MKQFLSCLLILVLLFLYSAFGEALVEDGIAITDDLVVEYGVDYSSPDEVALYLYAFSELPCNYIRKSDARDLGWDSSKGNLWDVAPYCSIGGDKFGNYEGLLPDAAGRKWYECDVNYDGGYRGAERLLFSSDGLICYSGDHYKSYELLYDGWYENGSRYNGITEVN